MEQLSCEHDMQVSCEAETQVRCEDEMRQVSSWLLGEWRSEARA